MNLKVVEFCAREVEYQGEGPLQVWWYIQAWDRAIWAVKKGVWDEYLLQFIRQLGCIVEKDKNPSAEEWRRVDVRVGSDVKPPYRDVRALMISWATSLSTVQLSPESVYEKFENIHPFVDGNGRVGKIIYNWRNGTLEDPVCPKTFPSEWEHHNQK